MRSVETMTETWIEEHFHKISPFFISKMAHSQGLALWTLLGLLSAKGDPWHSVFPAEACGALQDEPRPAPQGLQEAAFVRGRRIPGVDERDGHGAPDHHQRHRVSELVQVRPLRRPLAQGAQSPQGCFFLPTRGAENAGSWEPSLKNLLGRGQSLHSA